MMETIPFMLAAAMTPSGAAKVQIISTVGLVLIICTAKMETTLSSAALEMTL